MASVDSAAPRPESFDAIVIGTGQAGKPLAGALAEAGWSVAIIERARVGGTCVISGCTPTKTMIASARVAHLARRAGDYGVRVDGVSVDLPAVRERKRQMVDEWSEGARNGLESQAGVELIPGEARFAGPRRLEVRAPDGRGTRTLTAPKVFINTGTRSRRPDLPGLDRVEALDPPGLMELDRVPDHLIVIGGGFIGLEFAQMFRRFGAEVTILEASSRLVSREDDDVSEALREILVEEGVEVRLDWEPVEVEPVEGGGVRVRGRDGAVHGSHLFVAVGRIPNTAALRVEAAGLCLDDRGYIEVNDRLETNVEGIWALGEVNGGPPFTHVSYDDFRVVRDNLLGGGGGTRAGRMVPWTLFTDPQLGRIGLTEREASEEGREVRVGRLPMEKVARAREQGETRGFMKVLVDPRTDGIVGAAVLGMEGGEVMAVLQAAMMGEVPASRLREGIFAHPTLAESFNALFGALE